MPRQPDLNQQVLATWLTAACLALIATPLAAQDGQRCAWSPDGQHLLYLARQNYNWFVACYDVATGKSHRVLTAPNRDPFLGISWSPDGSEFATVSYDSTHPVTVTAHFVPFPRQGQPTTHVLNLATGYSSHGVIVHTGDALWMEANGALCLNRADGKLRRVPQAEGETVAPIALFDGGLAYVAQKKQTAPLEWEIGTLAPDSLTRTALYDHSMFPGWSVQPSPAFAPRFGRIAVAAYELASENQALLVLAAGKILTTQPLGHASDARPTDVAWSPHGDKVFAHLVRGPTKDAKIAQRLLFESTFSGSVTRETELFASEDTSMVRQPYGMSVSPNGKTAAVLVRHTFRDNPNLYLVDLSDKARKVTKVAALPGIEIVIRGSDLALEAATAWKHAWTADHTERRLRLLGGGSTAGVKALLDGSAQVAVTSRAVSATEHALAKAANIELDIQCFVRDVVVVCVHPDNALPSIGSVQLQRLFADKSDRQWSKLGVTNGEGSDAIETAMLQPGSPDYMAFRKAVLNNRGAAHGHTIKEQPEQLAEFVRTHRGALACLPIDVARKLGDAIRIVPIRIADVEVAPTEAAIKHGNYPLTNSWYQVTRTQVEPHVRTFLNWLATDEAKRATATTGKRPAK